MGYSFIIRIFLSICCVALNTYASEKKSLCISQNLERLLESETKTSRSRSQLRQAIGVSLGAHGVAAGVAVQYWPEHNKKDTASSEALTPTEQTPKKEETQKSQEKRRIAYSTQNKKNLSLSGVSDPNIDVIDSPSKQDEKPVIPEPPRKKLKSKAELISEAQQAIRIWKEKKKFKEDFGDFTIQTELVTEPSLKDAEILYASYDKNFRSDLREIHQFTQKSKDPNQQLENLRKKLYEKYFHNYYRSNAKLIDYYLSGQGNCVSQTLITTAALENMKSPISTGWTYGVQNFSDHIQPVLYNRNTKEVIEIVSGAKIQGVRAPIYEPARLYADYLRTQNIDPKIDIDQEFLIADMDKKYQAAASSQKSQLSESFTTNAVLKFHNQKQLPKYSQQGAPLHGHLKFADIHSENPDLNPDTSTVYGENSELAQDRNIKMISIYHSANLTFINFTRDTYTNVIRSLDNKAQSLTEQEAEMKIIPFLAPNHINIARNEIEKEVTSSSLLGMAFLAPVKKEKAIYENINYFIENLLLDEDFRTNQDSARQFYYKDKELFDQHSDFILKSGKNHANASYEFVLEKMLQALEKIGHDPNYLLTIQYLDNPDIYEKLTPDQIQKIVKTISTLNQLTLQMDAITNYLFLGKFYKYFSPPEWHDLIENNKIWSRYIQSRVNFFNKENKNPKLTIQKIDSLNSEQKSNLFKIHDLLGGTLFSALYKYARDPEKVRISNKDEEELEIALEKATIISLQGEDQNPYKITLEPIEPAQEDFYRKGKKPNGKLKKQPTSNEAKNVLKVKPDTMLGLVFLRHDDIAYNRKKDSDSNQNPHELTANEHSKLLLGQSSFSHPTPNLSQWSPRLIEELKKSNTQGRWDIEFIHTVLNNEFINSVLSSKQLNQNFGSPNAIILQFTDNRTDENARNREEGGEFPTQGKFLIPEKLLPLVQDAYKRRFGSSVKVEASAPIKPGLSSFENQPSTPHWKNKSSGGGGTGGR